MIRALVADDSETFRTLLVEILRRDPEIEVVGEAKDGVEAVEMTRRLKPDVVTMDVQMPRMDGLEATKEIMIEAPTPIVVVTAGIDAGEVSISMDALRAGAVCVMQKPVGPRVPGHFHEVRQLVDTIKSMAAVKVVRQLRDRAIARRPAPVARGGRPRALAIAASTGGPAALHRLLSALPADFPAPIFIVQHMAAGFVPGLATWLGKASALRVRVAEAGEPVRPQTVYVAADDLHLGVSKEGTLELSTAPPVAGFRPSATVLFESVAKAFGAAAVGLILTGMGDDGVAGLHALKAAGGRVLAQDQASSVVFGMPGAAIAAGLASAGVALDALPARLLELFVGEAS